MPQKEQIKEPIIRLVPLFTGLPHSEIHNLATTLNTIHRRPGELVFREGEHGDRFFVVLSGEIEILKSMDTADERLIAVRGPGEYIGEMSLFEENHLRTASVRARTQIELMEMTHADFDALLHRQPSITYELVRELSARLAGSHNATIRDLSEKNRQLTRAYEELKAAQAQLVEKERLEKELAVARQIQQSILPTALPSLPGFDVSASIIPTRAVGGDLFDVIDLGGRRLGIAVADVSDKGVPAAIFMALVRSLLRAEAARAEAPGEVLRNVNRVLLDMNDAGMFVTVLYGILDAASREFRFARAGHELPLVFDERGALLPVQRASGQPLGLFEEPRLDEQAVVIQPDGLMVIYTDGVTDQQDETGAFYGLDRLCAAALPHRLEPARVVCEQLLRSVLTFRGTAVQSDDITLLAVCTR